MFRAIRLTPMNCLHKLNSSSPSPTLLTLTLKIEVKPSSGAFEKLPHIQDENLLKWDTQPNIR